MNTVNSDNIKLDEKEKTTYCNTRMKYYIKYNTDKADSRELNYQN